MPTIPRTIFPKFARALDYPDELPASMLKELENELRSLCPDAAVAVSRFLEDVAQRSLGELQEIHARTFDVAPVCVPYVSVHLFGEESFKRAELMAGLCAAFERSNFDRGRELPDHLCVILRFAPNFSDEEWTDMVRHCLLGPIQVMVQALKRTASPYSNLLCAIQSVLQKDFPKEVQSCSTHSCSSVCPTYPLGYSSADQFGDTDPTSSATPPCHLSFLRTGGCCGDQSPGMQES